MGRHNHAKPRTAVAAEVRLIPQARDAAPFERQRLHLSAFLREASSAMDGAGGAGGLLASGMQYWGVTSGLSA